MELWKFIDGYENYQISNYGNIKCTQTDKLLKPTVGTIGYKVVNLSNEDKKKKQHYIHRLVAYAFLDNPNNYKKVDHKNRNRTDNHFSNLRYCSDSENQQNMNIRTTSKSGCTGVCFATREQKFLAQIAINKKTIHIGYFETFEEAKEARLKKEKELFKEFAPN